MTITISITQEEYDLLESWLGVGQVEVWLQNALDNKIRRRLDATITEQTNFNPKKLSRSDKMTELGKIKLKSREERGVIIM